MTAHPSDVQREGTRQEENGLVGHPPDAPVRSRFCRRCGSYYELSSTTTLSVHWTSSAIVTYFRCPLGHADFSCGR